jgi:hypothetical protein
MGMDLERALRGAVAGGAAATIWAAQEPLDRRVFGYPFSDVELLGKLMTRERGWPAAGFALHVQNGAAFGALYSVAGARLPGPPMARGVLAAIAEHMSSWPLTALTDRFHPARDELPPLARRSRAFLQATWRHLLFGAVLGVLEGWLNAESPPSAGAGDVPAAHNGHGRLEDAVPVVG